MNKSLYGSLALALVLIILNYFLFTVDEQDLRTWILNLVTFDSAAENDYAASFLTSALILKARWSVLLISGLILALHRVIYTLGVKLLAEWKSTGMWRVLKGGSRDHYWILLTMIFLFIAGMIMIPFIQINSDEAYAFAYFTAQNPLIAVTTYPAPNNHILYSFCSSLIYQVIPWKLYALRLPSLITGISTVGILWIYLQRSYSKSAIILSSIVVLISFYPVFYMVQGRGYAMFLLWSTMLTILVLESCRKKSWHLPLTSVFVSVLGFYTIPLFLYPFAISLAVMLLFVRLKSVLIWGTATTILISVLYAPIVLFFGLDALIGNEFVIPQTLDAISLAYPNYLWATCIHLIPVVMVLIISFVFFTEDKRDYRYLLLIFLVSGSLLIPFVQRVFPPFRSFIYLYPIAVIVLTVILNKRTHWWPIVPVMLIFNIYFGQKNYETFNAYSAESKQILAQALQEKESRIYLLDGPRSIFQWYLADAKVKQVDFHYSLNRDSLDMDLLERKDMLFISEYRYKDVLDSTFQTIDSTNYFLLFRKK